MALAHERRGRRQNWARRRAFSIRVRARRRPEPESAAIGENGPKEGSLKRIILAAFAAALTLSAALADEFGLATFYHNPNHGGLIAAHRTLRFGTQVRVHNLDTGRSAVVTIVDRGPFAYGRVIDVSTVAADALGMRQAGVARVRLELVQ